MPRVVVPTESEEQALGESQRRRKGVLVVVVALVCVAAAAAAAFWTYRARTPKPSADTVFVSAPAWPKGDPRPGVTQAVAAAQGVAAAGRGVHQQEGCGGTRGTPGGSGISGERGGAGECRRLAQQGDSERDGGPDHGPPTGRLAGKGTWSPDHHHRAERNPGEVASRPARKTIVVTSMLHGSYGSAPPGAPLLPA